MAYEFGNIVGRGIVTVIVLTFLGSYGALFVVGMLYIISAVTIIPIERNYAAIKPLSLKPSFVKSILAGYRYLFSNKELLLYAFVQAIILMSLMAAPVLVGPYVKTVLQAGSSVFGMSEAVISIGAIVGAFFWSYLANHISKELCLASASILASISYFNLANNNEIIFALAAFLLLGFSWGSFALIMSLVQTLTDKNYQGRVQAAIGAAVTTIFICFSIFLHYFDKGYNTKNAFMLLGFSCFIIFFSSIIAKKFKK